jgi:heptosyltransferase I
LLRILKQILIVKLSSLGDVVHTLPCIADIRSAYPDAQIDWVVERGFAPLLAKVNGLRRVIACDIRRWTKNLLSAQTRSEWAAFKTELQQTAYDAVLDLQGLTKSAVVARTARLATGGKRFAMANRTDGSGYEAPTRWLADSAIVMPAHIHALTRGRTLCAASLGYQIPQFINYSFNVCAIPSYAAIKNIVFIHGSSRDDKAWPMAHWVALGRHFVRQGFSVVLPQSNMQEEAQAHRIAAQLGNATVLPRMGLDALVEAFAPCGGAIGVDSGLSHIAVALDLPHVQLYNFDTAWRTGPVGSSRQCSVFAQPAPSVAQVVAAWESVVDAIGRDALAHKAAATSAGVDAA